MPDESAFALSSLNYNNYSLNSWKIVFQIHQKISVHNSSKLSHSKQTEEVRYEAKVAFITRRRIIFNISITRLCEGINPNGAIHRCTTTTT